MPKDISRRSFLKSSVVAACATCAAQVPLPAAASARTDQELATLIDIRKCILFKALCLVFQVGHGGLQKLQVQVISYSGNMAAL